MGYTMDLTYLGSRCLGGLARFKEGIIIFNIQMAVLGVYLISGQGHVYICIYIKNIYIIYVYTHTYTL